MIEQSLQGLPSGHWLLSGSGAAITELIYLMHCTRGGTVRFARCAVGATAENRHAVCAHDGDEKHDRRGYGMIFSA